MKPLGTLSRFLLLCALASVVAFELHEIGHFILGSLTGLDLEFKVTYVEGPTSGMTQAQALLFNLGGPLTTFSLAIAALVLARRRGRFAEAFLALSVANSWLRIWAMVRALSHHQTFQDEYKIAALLDLPGGGVAAASLLVAIVLFVLAIASAPNHRLARAPVTIVGCFIGMGATQAFAPFFVR